MIGFEQAFAQITAVLLLATAVGVLALLLRQPLVVAFIAVGILAGPSVLHWVKPGAEVELLAQFGVALLLFVVGLRLDPGLIRSMGRVALITGVGQVLFTSLAGYFLARALGLAAVPALYVAVALTFSSTIIIVKLLSDKRELDSLHGRIAVGFLIVQDLLVIVAMVVLSALAPAGGRAEPLGGIVLRGVGLLAAVAALARWVLPPLLQRLARSGELLVLFAVTWAAALAAAAEYAGLSREVGAFLAGISLASTPYREAIGSRLVSLRDFLLLFFFVDMGARMDLGRLGGQLGPALALSGFVLIGNPLIVVVLLGALGYRRRTSFFAGLAVAQISEFSLVLAALGVELGHIDRSVLALITLVGLITIAVSTYLILYSQPLYRLAAPLLRPFERQNPMREAAGAPAPVARFDVVLFGLGRYGSRLAASLAARGRSVLGIDFDPRVVGTSAEGCLQARYGDAEDFELPAGLPLEGVRWVISSVHDRRVNLTILRSFRHHGFAGRVAVTAHTEEDARALAAAGADLVLRPFEDAAEDAAHRLATEILNA